MQSLHCYFGFSVDRLSFLLNISIVPEYKKKCMIKIISYHQSLFNFRIIFFKLHIVLLFYFSDKIFLNLKYVVSIAFEFGI